MNYDELAALVGSLPRIPKREIKCHPSVVVALRESSGPVSAVTAFGFVDMPRDLLFFPIFEDDTLTWGEWYLREDDEVVASGMLSQ